MIDHTSKFTEAFDMDAIIAGDARLSAEQALWLYHHATLADLGTWANAITTRIHGETIRTYVIDRNINYSNVCSARCTFCAFYRKVGDEDGYVLTNDQLFEKLQELSDIGGTQVLLQGGMHPELPLKFYEQMLNDIRERFPHIHLHAFSPPEFVEFVAVADVGGFPSTLPGKSHTIPREQWLEKLRVIMKRLMDAGLASVPGGGGEVFPEHVRRRIGKGKATGQQWLDVMRTAHQLGMKTSSTMMFGHIEGAADRVAHMSMIRDAQDEAMSRNWPGRYVSFISWPFQPENTPLGRLPQWNRDQSEGAFPGDVLADLIFEGKVDAHDKSAAISAVPEAGKILRLAGATEYLRMQALSRIFFDNIFSIGSSWVTMGPKIGQLGLFYGANDMGSVMMEENVVSSAGTTYCLNEATICRLIRDAGFTPAQRGNSYEILKSHDASGPDLEVTDWSTVRPAASAFGSGEDDQTPETPVALEIDTSSN